MGIFQLKGEILKYSFNTDNSAPSSSFTAQTSLSIAFSALSVNSEAYLYISNESRGEYDASGIIDLLDGVKSDKKNTPVKSGSGKSEPKIPSSRCSLSDTRGNTLVFDIFTTHSHRVLTLMKDLL